MILHPKTVGKCYDLVKGGFNLTMLLGLVRKIELDLGGGSTVEMEMPTAGISDATYSDTIRATEINPRR